jgi:hypothetical protein
MIRAFSALTGTSNCTPSRLAVFTGIQCRIFDIMKLPQQRSAVMKLLSAIMLVLFMGNAWPSDTPEDAADKFYAAVLAGRYGSCLPKESELKNLSPLISKRLTGLIRAALAYRDQFVKDHPDEKSKDGLPFVMYKQPFSDGDCFSSNVEHATSFKLGKTGKIPTGYRVELRLTYIDSIHPNEKPFEWTDAVIVIREDNRFVVDDMEFLGTWPYGNHGSLSKLLNSRK